MFLGIYGSNGLGREMLELAKKLNTFGRWGKIYFIDDTKEEFAVQNTELLSLEKAKVCFQTNELEITIATGEPHYRVIMWDKISEAGFGHATLIHPNVFISDTTVIGEGVTIFDDCFISCNNTIANNVLILPHVCVGHDCMIGKNTVLSSGVIVGGFTTIGSETYISLSVPIKDRVSIGSNSIVGIGSAVIRDIPDNVVAMGIPARTVRINDTHRVFS